MVSEEEGFAADELSELVDGGVPEASEEERAEEKVPIVGPPSRARTSKRSRERANAAGLVNRRLAKGVHQPFLRTLHQFQGSLTTLREISDKLTPAVESWPDENMEAFDQALAGHTEEQKAALLQFASDALPGLFRGTLYFARQSDADGDSEAETEADQAEAEPAVRKAWQLVAEKLDGDMGAAYEVLHILYLKITTPERAMTFHRSLLVSAVSALDNLMLELISKFYLVNPDALGQETTFTLAELNTFADIREAKFAAVERKADQVVRQGLDGWTKWLREQGIDLRTHCADFPTFAEVIQRRHIAVHNDSRVSRAYQKKLKDLDASPEAEPEIGQTLEIDADYLHLALDELESAGNLIAGAVWTKALSDAEDLVLYEFYVRTYELLVADRWRPTACICEAAQKRLPKDDDLFLIHKVNELLARKRMGEDVKAEVESWNAGTLALPFQLSRSALLDDEPTTRTLLMRAVRAGDLELEDVAEWPLFYAMKRSEDWPAFLEELSKVASKLEPDSDEDSID